MMKKLHLLLMTCLLFILCSCKNETDKALEEVALLKKIQEQELAKGERYDTILLNYRLGMSRLEWQKHSDSLVEIGKLVKNDDGDFIYDFGKVSGAGDTDLKISFFFDDDKLWLSSCDFTNPEVSIFEVNKILPNKKGSAILFSLDGVDIIKYIYRNRQLNLRRDFEGATIEYFDLPTKLKLDKEQEVRDSLERQDVKQKLKEDF
ncbi:hypothetical protein [Flavobacterium beibuense]|uniref:hypothetical protein n=1 Tax=Flavobacterium beibuense TaxID=657326 RepID=UPI003A95D15C